MLQKVEPTEWLVNVENQNQNLLYHGSTEEHGGKHETA